MQFTETKTNIETVHHSDYISYVNVESLISIQNRKLACICF